MSTSTNWPARRPPENGNDQVGFTQTYHSNSECVEIVRRNHPHWKRALDTCGVLLIIPLLAPLLLAVALYIKLVSRGPIFFVQRRVGYGGEPFQIHKFRTMRVSDVNRDDNHRKLVASYTNGNGAMRKPKHQDEFIPGGNLIRSLSIDELPQLYDVLTGNMSLVGPRPDVLQLEDYEPEQLRRFEVLPGMTGLWQVSGKNRLSFEKMVELDIEYIETRSLLGDLMIMARTIVVLLFERNE